MWILIIVDKIVPFVGMFRQQTVSWVGWSHMVKLIYFYVSMFIISAVLACLHLSKH